MVNSTSDLFSAESGFGLTTRDVALAPMLREAWAALSPLFAGRVPTGVGVDAALSLIDSELKRGGMVTRMPLGAELPDNFLNVQDHRDLRSHTALE